MMLAGIYVSADDVRELAALVDEPTATLLERALELKTLLVALTIHTRETVADALDLLAIDPRGRGYPLLGTLAGFWACRTPGNYRIKYKIRGRGDSTVIVYTIRHRARAYI